MERLVMVSGYSEISGSSAKNKIVTDSVHGDIRPTDLEWKIIDTPAFQRLRKLKQLQMGYLVYPNATHTRFAHSLGVLHVMDRILTRVGGVTEEQKEDLRLAALLHDIGHYPYSHLLEGVDDVVLTEDRISPKSGTLMLQGSDYPDHEQVGQEILLHQRELLDLLGGKDKAARIGQLFAGQAIVEEQLSKLLHSSLDMDRLDYLIRDSQATGVPYGQVDIHYLLNHVRRSPSGTLGITLKAVAAAEHLLLARSFLFRVVCQHKTVYGFEEVARQLLRRLRDRGQDGGEHYNVPLDGDQVLKIARGENLGTFTDAMLDEVFVKAANPRENDPLIRILAQSIVSRRPPRLLWSKQTFRSRDDDHNDFVLFENYCKLHLEELAKQHNLELGQFLICDLKSVGFESRGPQVSMEQAAEAISSGEEEMIRVFTRPDDPLAEPEPIVHLKHSILHELGSHVFKSYRLYVVCGNDVQESCVEKLKAAMSSWK